MKSFVLLSEHPAVMHSRIYARADLVIELLREEVLGGVPSGHGRKSIRDQAAIGLAYRNEASFVRAEL